MNITNRLNIFEERVALLESKSGKSFSIMFDDNGKLYHYELIDGKRFKIYPTEEVLNEYRKKSKSPIITFDKCLDQEKLLI